MKSKQTNRKFKVADFLLKRLGESPRAVLALDLVKTEVNKYKKLIVTGALLIFLGALLLLPLPFITGKIIDVIIPRKEPVILLAAVGILMASNIIASVMSYFQELLFFKLNNKMIIDIRMALFKKINRMPLAISRKYSTGYLMSRLKDDPPRLADMFGEQIIQLVKHFFVLIVSLSALVYINWKLTILSIMLIPFFLYTVYYFGQKIKKQSEIVFERVAVSSRSLQENLDMVELCKSVGRETFNTRRYLAEIVKTYRALVESKKLESLNSVILGFIGAVLPLSILGYGGYQVILGQLTIGMLITFITLLSNVVGPASSLIGFNIQIQKLKVALDRVGEILDFPEEPSLNRTNTKPINELKINDLVFSYGAVEPILKNISLTAEKGKKIAIVGPSGSGKTTLSRAISGLWEFSGTICVDGSPTGSRDSINLRKIVATVPQEPFLFNDTIYANVAVANPRACEQEVTDALVRSNAWEFVDKMKDKMHTIVGEKGSSLSGGQKQRIAIARAIVKNAGILILDEATSHVDNISAKMITEAIDKISKDKIVIIIAHNLETVTNCDKIIFLKNGKIVETGSHPELMAIEGGHYALQFNGFSTAP